MDPTSNAESTPWDPITGKLRAHAGLKLPKGTRDALAKHTKNFDDTQGLSSTSTRCPTTGATSAVTTAPGSPRRHSLGDTLDLTQPSPLKQTQMHKSASQTRNNRANSVPPGEAACGSGKRAVRFLADQRSPSRERSSAMQADPGRYDVDPSVRRRKADSSSPSLTRQDSMTSQSSTGKAHTTTSEWDGTRHIPPAMKADPARYDVAPRGSAAAREYNDAAKHVMHMKADPRNDVLHDGTGRNPDGDGQTMIGIEIKERFSDMKSAFLKIDADYDGRITHRELMQACVDWNIPLSEATRVLNCTDLDQKGFIDFDEFAQHFDPVLEVSPDDEELLRLYQEGVMGGEQPIKLAGATHGTSSAEPIVDETQHYRSDNADLRSRLARSMRQVSELTSDLKASRAHAADLGASLDDANRRNSELQGRNAELEGVSSVLRRKLEQAEEDNRRMAREANYEHDRDEDMKATRLRQEDLDSRLRARQRAAEEEEGAAERRRLARQLAEASADCRRLEDEDESKTVFVYGIEGCDKCEAMYKALDKAKVPYQRRDFNKDKRFMAPAKKTGLASTDALYAPVVCLGDKAWWKKDDEGAQLVPFPVEVAMELRRELGLCLPTPEKVREDVDIDTEIYARFTSMQEAFLKMDDNQDGFITEEEVMARCRQWNIPTSEAQRIISEADRDGKGYLDFDEFAKRFGGLWNSGSRGPLRSLAPAPNHMRPKQPKNLSPARPGTSPAVVRR